MACLCSQPLQARSPQSNSGRGVRAFSLPSLLQDRATAAGVEKSETCLTIAGDEAVVAADVAVEVIKEAAVAVVIKE